MCSVSYLCRFLSYCLQLVSYPYLITDCLSSVSLSFFVFFLYSIKFNFTLLLGFLPKKIASNSVYCLTLIHINTHYTIQYNTIHTHTHKGMFVHSFFVLYCIFLYCIIFLLVWYWQGLWKFYGIKDHKKKIKKKKKTIPWYILLSWYRISHIVI